MLRQASKLRILSVTNLAAVSSLLLLWKAVYYIVGNMFYIILFLFAFSIFKVILEVVLGAEFRKKKTFLSPSIFL